MDGNELLDKMVADASAEFTTGALELVELLGPNRTFGDQSTDEKYALLYERAIRVWDLQMYRDKYWEGTRE